MRMIARWNHETEIVPAGSVKEVRPKVDIWGRKIRANRASIITEEQALEAFRLSHAGRHCQRLPQAALRISECCT